MKKESIDVVVCPYEQYHPLTLYVLEEEEDIIEGLIVCPKCHRWYPIVDGIPYTLLDESRKIIYNLDLEFLNKWKERIPARIVKKGKPINLDTSQ